MQRNKQLSKRVKKFKEDSIHEEQGRNNLSLQNKNNQNFLSEKQHSLDKQFKNRLDLEQIIQNQSDDRKEDLAPWESKEANKLSSMNDLEIDNGILQTKTLFATNGSQTDYIYEQKKFILPLHQIRSKAYFPNTPTMLRHELQNTEFSNQMEFNLISQNSLKQIKNESQAKSFQSPNHQYYSNQLYPNTLDYSKNFESASLLDQQDRNINQLQFNNCFEKRNCLQSSENTLSYQKVQEEYKKLQLDNNKQNSKTVSSLNKFNLIYSNQKKVTIENQNVFTPRFIHISSTERESTPIYKSNVTSYSLEQFKQIRKMQNFLKSIQSDSSKSQKIRQNPFKTFYYQSPQMGAVNCKTDANYDQEINQINTIKDLTQPSFLHINKVDFQRQDKLSQKKQTSNHQKVILRQNDQPQVNNQIFTKKSCDKPKKQQNNINEESCKKKAAFQDNKEISKTDQLDQSQNFSLFKQIFPKKNGQFSCEKKRQNFFSEDYPLICKFLKNQNIFQYLIFQESKESRDGVSRVPFSNQGDLKQAELKMANCYFKKKIQQKTNFIYFLSEDNNNKSLVSQNSNKITEEINPTNTDRLSKTGTNFFKMNEKRNDSYRIYFYSQNSSNTNSMKQVSQKMDFSQYKNFKVLEDFIQKKEQENCLKKSNTIMNQNMMKYKQHIQQKKQLKLEEDQQINTMLHNYIQFYYSQILQKFAKSKKIQEGLNLINVNTLRLNQQKKSIEQILINLTNIK